MIAIEDRILDRTQYLAVRAAWKGYLALKTGAAWHHLAYLLLLEKDVDAGFKPLSSPKRIEMYAKHQGRGPRYKLTDAISTLRVHIDVALRKHGRLPEAERTPAVRLDLKPSEVFFLLDEGTLRVLGERVAALKA